jgi:hypothetical protein
MLSEVVTRGLVLVGLKREVFRHFGFLLLTDFLEGDIVSAYLDVGVGKT